MKILGNGNLKALSRAWSEHWPEALAVWSRFTKLRRPRWCFNQKEARQENLDSSFAMIRLVDHVVVIDLAQIKAKGLEKYAREEYKMKKENEEIFLIEYDTVDK